MKEKRKLRCKIFYFDNMAGIASHRPGSKSDIFSTSARLLKRFNSLILGNLLYNIGCKNESWI